MTKSIASVFCNYRTSVSQIVTSVRLLIFSCRLLHFVRTWLNLLRIACDILSMDIECLCAACIVGAQP